MESTISTTTENKLVAAPGPDLSAAEVGVRRGSRSNFEGGVVVADNSEISGAAVAMPAQFPIWKRCFDGFLILLAAPCWVPVCLLIALVIRLGSRGPVLFRQERVGQGGRVFICFKFRTMHLNASQMTHRDHVKDLITSSSPMIKLDDENDGRLIRGGSWIRAAGLDELPQLINIIRGDMSIVGPRPCIPYEYEMYQPWQRRRCQAPPGLTGLWQVSGKNHTTFSQMVNLDIDYARRMSLWLDIQILVRTPLVIIQQVLEMRAAKRDRVKAG
jgi:lipopolysaccharide/colanic/teichoic acid biosynthesis glycosyltransferase